MELDKDEIKKNKYSIASSFFIAFVLFLFFHFGNILGLTDNSKEASAIIIVIVLYLLLLVATITVIFYAVKNKKDPNKRIRVFRNWVKVFSVCILIIATFGLFVFVKSINNFNIPPYIFKIINQSDTIQSVSSTVEISIAKPESPLMNRQVAFVRGQLSQNNSIQEIIIQKKDTAFVSLNFNSTKSLYDFYKSEQFEMTVIMNTSNGKFLTINFPFTENVINTKYSECKIE